MLVDGDGGPLGVAVAGANVNDFKLLPETIAAVVVQRPICPQRLCLDRGYDNPYSRYVAVANGYIPHIRGIGTEKLDAKGNKTLPARRWVVERTLGWLSRHRNLLVRYEKKAANHLGLLQLACLLIWFRRLWRLTLLR